MIGKCMVAAFFGCFLSAVSSGGENALTQEAQGKFNKFLDVVLGAKTEGSPRGEFKSLPAPSASSAPMAKIDGGEWTAMVNGATGQPYHFGWKKDSPADALARNQTHKDAISKERAFNAFLPIAVELSLPTSQAEYSIELEDYGEYDYRSAGASEKDLWGATWHISYDFTYHGLPCITRGIDVDVSAASGRIESFRYRPVVIPEEKERKVTKEQAVEAVKTWLSASACFAREAKATRIPEDALSKTTMVIAFPLPFPEGHLTTEEETVPPSTYYCWEVPFQAMHPMSKGSWYTGVVWVDANSGAVIGGGGVRPERK